MSRPKEKTAIDGIGQHQSIDPRWTEQSLMHGSVTALTVAV